VSEWGREGEVKAGEIVCGRGWGDRWERMRARTRGEMEMLEGGKEEVGCDLYTSR